MSPVVPSRHPLLPIAARCHSVSPVVTRYYPLSPVGTADTRRQPFVIPYPPTLSPSPFLLHSCNEKVRIRKKSETERIFSTHREYTTPCYNASQQAAPRYSASQCSSAVCLQRCTKHSRSAGHPGQLKGKGEASVVGVEGRKGLVTEKSHIPSEQERPALENRP